MQNTYLDPHRGVLILVLGILSVVTLPLLGPFAWILGRGDQAAMDEGTMDPAGRDMTKIGTILGMIGTAILVLGLLIWILVFVVFAGAAVVSMR